ncbi:MAG: flagellar filament capping protein FliD [Pseudomonadota bacterium]
MDISPLSILQNIAGFKSQMIGSLFGSSDDPKGDFFSALMAQKRAASHSPTDAVSLLAQAKGSPSTGRNSALFDPESAFKMMSTINNRDVLHKAEFSEMSKMSGYVEHIEAVGQHLSGITASTPNSDIQAQLQSFAAEYNSLVQRFKPSVQNGGMLEGVQAAEISLYELEQSVKYKFFGAKDGLNGLSDLGITIDPLTKQATLDSGKLDAVLARDKQAAVNTVQEFSANFAKSADLLNAEGNFIPNRLNNLSRAIHYIADHKDSLQAEFGLGDPAKPNKQVAQALAAYNQIYGS